MCNDLRRIQSEQRKIAADMVEHGVVIVLDAGRFDKSPVKRPTPFMGQFFGEGECIASARQPRFASALNVFRTASCSMASGCMSATRTRSATQKG